MAKSSVAETALGDPWPDAGSISREMEASRRLSCGRAKLCRDAVGIGQSDRSWTIGRKGWSAQAWTPAESRSSVIRLAANSRWDRTRRVREPIGFSVMTCDGVPRTARAVPTPLLCRKTMISRTTFCSAQASVIRFARTAPMPVTSRSRSGSASMTSNTFSPKALTIFLAWTGPIPRIIPEPRYFSIRRLNSVPKS